VLHNNGSGCKNATIPVSSLQYADWSIGEPGTQLTPFNRSSFSSFVAASWKPEVPFVVEMSGSKLPSLTASPLPLMMASAIA